MSDNHARLKYDADIVRESLLLCLVYIGDGDYGHWERRQIVAETATIVAGNGANVAALGKR